MENNDVIDRFIGACIQVISDDIFTQLHEALISQMKSKEVPKKTERERLWRKGIAQVQSWNVENDAIVDEAAKFVAMLGRNHEVIIDTAVQRHSRLIGIMTPAPSSAVDAKIFICRHLQYICASPLFKNYVTYTELTVDERRVINNRIFHEMTLPRVMCDHHLMRTPKSPASSSVSKSKTSSRQIIYPPVMSDNDDDDNDKVIEFGVASPQVRNEALSKRSISRASNKAKSTSSTASVVSNTPLSTKSPTDNKSTASQ